MGMARKALIGGGLVLTAATLGSLVYNAAIAQQGEPATQFAPAHEFVGIDGYRTHVVRRLPTDKATQPAIVLLHGFGGWAFTWRKNLDVLGQRFPSYAYDRYGFGLSDKPADLDYSPTTYVAQLRGLLELFDLKRVVLVGHSAGGPIALRAAVELGPCVVGLVLAASAGLESPPPTALVKLFARTPFARTLTRLMVRGAVYQRIAKFGYYQPESADADIAAGYSLPTKTEGAENGVLGLLRSGNPNTQARTWATQVRIPTLVLTADHDKIVLPTRARGWADLIPHAQLATITNAGHLMMEEQAAQFNQLVLNFVEKINA